MCFRSEFYTRYPIYHYVNMEAWRIGVQTTFLSRPTGLLQLLQMEKRIRSRY